MDQTISVLLAIDKADTVPQRALDCEPGLFILYFSAHITLL